MCLESTGLHEITFNFIKNIHCYPPRGVNSHHLSLAILSLEPLLNKLCNIQKVTGCEKLATFLRHLVYQKKTEL